MDISQGIGDLHGEPDESLHERNQNLVDRAIDIAGLAVEAFHEELALQTFNHEV
jgi:hypothetical protein